MVNTDPFSHTEQTVLDAVAYIGAGISIIAGIFIIISYVLYPALRSFPYKLIVWMSLADLISSLSYVLSYYSRRYESVCQTQAALSQFFTLAAYFWTGCFCFNIMIVLVLNKSNVEQYEIYYHVCVWGLASICLGINFLFNSFGQDVIWCWVSQDDELFRLLTFYAPLILTFLFNLACYFIVVRSLKGDLKEVAISRRLRLYLLVFFIVRFWSILNRLQNYISPNNPLWPLYFMHALFSPLQGFFHAGVYGLNQKVRQHYYGLICLPFTSHHHQQQQPETQNLHNLANARLTTSLLSDSPDPIHVQSSEPNLILSPNASTSPQSSPQSSPQTAKNRTPIPPTSVETTR